MLTVGLPLLIGNGIVKNTMLDTSSFDTQLSDCVNKIKLIFVLNDSAQKKRKKIYSRPIRFVLIEFNYGCNLHFIVQVYISIS